MKRFSLVVAVSMPDFGIGLNGALPWPNLKEDMKFFKKITTETKDEKKLNAVIMGRNTWNSIPSKFRPLPNRFNVVLTTNPQSIEEKVDEMENVKICDSFESALQELNGMSNIEHIFICGGAKLYQSASQNPFLDKIYLTRVFKTFECDTFLSKDFFNNFVACDHGMPPLYVTDDGTQFEFTTLVPKNRIPSEMSALKGTLHPEYQYLNLIRDIMENGVERPDRTGVGTLSKFGATMRFDLRDNVFPLLTTKRVFWKGVAEELIWFVKGSTNANELAEKNIHIWDGNGSREFLDSIGLTHRAEGDLGPVYGFQWRHFGAEYSDMNADYSGKGVDQLNQIIDTIKNRPFDRRIVMTAWNPAALKEMALPPCHMFCQFYVANGELSCQMYQRSCDMGLGVPFNIASYALLTRMVAKVCGLEAGEFIHVLGDAHVYLNHVDALKIQLEREPKPFPKLLFNANKEYNTIEDFQYSDFEIVGYKPHKAIKMQMAV